MKISLPAGNANLGKQRKTKDLSPHQATETLETLCNEDKGAVYDTIGDILENMAALFETLGGAQTPEAPETPGGARTHETPENLFRNDDHRNTLLTYNKTLRL